MLLCTKVNPKGEKCMKLKSILSEWTLGGQGWTLTGLWIGKSCWFRKIKEGMTLRNKTKRNWGNLVTCSSASSGNLCISPAMFRSWSILKARLHLESAGPVPRRKAHLVHAGDTLLSHQRGNSILYMTEVIANPNGSSLGIPQILQNLIHMLAFSKPLLVLLFGNIVSFCRCPLHGTLVLCSVSYGVIVFCVQLLPLSVNCLEIHFTFRSPVVLALCLT